MMGPQRRFFVLAAASVAALVSAAAPAGAADLVKSGTELQYSSDAGELFSLNLSISGNIITFNGNDPLTLGRARGARCIPGAQDASCSITGITQIDIDTGPSTATGANSLNTPETSRSRSRPRRPRQRQPRRRWRPGHASPARAATTRSPATWATTRTTGETAPIFLGHIRDGGDDLVCGARDRGLGEPADRHPTATAIPTPGRSRR